MSPKLFSEFVRSTKADWLNQVKLDLPGIHYSDLQTEIAESLILDPYYVENEVGGALVSELCSSQDRSGGWLNQPHIHWQTDDLTNQEIGNALQNGADAIWLSLGSRELSDRELNRTLHSVRLTDIPVVFESSAYSVHFLERLLRGTGYAIKGGFAWDPLAGEMMGETVSMDWINSVEKLLTRTSQMKDFRPLMVESHSFHNAGSDVVQELAFTISKAVCYLDLLTNRGLAAETVLPGIFFSISVGTDYLTELAKLRAFRFLIKRIASAYQVSEFRPFIHVRTSSLYHTLREPEVNLLRVTSEAMSAVSGGCDALTISPYVSQSGKNHAFSERIARNVSLILREEALMDKVMDPAAGSYFIDKLSAEIAEKAWALFLQVEELGGLTEAFKSQVIQRQIAQAWKQKILSFQKGSVMVGINKYTGTSEQVASGTFSKDVVEQQSDYYLKPRKMEWEILNSRSI